ncbi:MAG TPA: pyrroline-5-carboxylate reductase [Opitutaceae bacterium]|nr:pyrroline-5-carboxylate reductase [Opitutaceae bacterium]
MKIAFLGAGKMATAMVEGLLERKTAAAADLACMDVVPAAAAKLAARTGIAAAGSPEELLARADALVVAFKPQNLADADPRLAPASRGKLVLSILAGTRLARLAQAFPEARNLVRCMPNTPGQIGAGITAWSPLRPLSAGDRAAVEAILGALGRTLEVPESQLDAVTALSGSGPGYVFEFASALCEAGAAAGLEPEQARALALQTLIGSAKLLEKRQAPPEQLRDEVVSPNGTTHAGLQRMAQGGFRDLIRQAVLAAKARSEELGRG